MPARPIHRTGKPIPTARTPRRTVPIANSTPATANACLGVIQPRTTAPLTGLTRRSKPRLKSTPSFTRFAPTWSSTMPKNAAANLSQPIWAPPIVTAIAVPKITGMVDAVSEYGRAAIHQSLKNPGFG